MPIYEYQCAECGHTAEVFQKNTDPDESQCPACSKGKLRRLISAGSFVLKGGGWYVTDFRDQGKKSKEAADSEPGKGESGKTVEGKNGAPKKETSSSKEAASSDAGKADGKTDSKADSKSGKTDAKPASSSSTSE